MNPADLIVAKRDGQALSPDQIRALIDAYTRGDVPDYQMSALLMAALLKGMNDEETAALTDAMLHSGVVLDLSDVPGTKVDKHSTGGVGDKVSLILAPLVAACGVPVPMVSGRGLGHTGGTLDKLESIPGLRTDLSLDEYKAQLEQLGVVMIGQTEEMAPADRKLYALRDVTGTVEFIPFIAASIMSKKLAEGIDALVLDVKCGRGAFMKEEPQARRLAETLVAIGERAGKRTTALMTDMSAPLGRAVGNWPEVEESIRCLRSEATEGSAPGGTSAPGAQGGDMPDLMEVVYALAGEMLALGREASTPEEGRQKAREAIRSGAAFEKFAELVEAQGGDTSVLEAPDTREGATPVAEVQAGEDADGFVADLDALTIGRAALRLGAGRKTMEDEVDPTAGLYLEKKPGDPVTPGDVLARLYTRNEDTTDAVAALVREAYAFSEAPPEPHSLLMGRYADEAWSGGQGA